MGEIIDRRAAKKARTRAHIRSVARGMFAEEGFDAVTIADVAGRADVAVQTVFNHFATKEELFFDGRTPWVTGPADAVRNRPPTESPLSALKGYLTGLLHGYTSVLDEARTEAYVRTLEGSPALRAHERELVFQSERRLADALAEAWSAPAVEGAPPVPQHTSAAAELAAAMWLNTARALFARLRPLIGTRTDTAAIAGDLDRFADRLMDRLVEATELLRDAPVTLGTTPVPHRRAG